MEYIIDTENITLDFSENRKDKDLFEYRLTVFDENCHYSDEIHLNKKHLIDLLQGLTNNQEQINNSDSEF